MSAGSRATAARAACSASAMRSSGIASNIPLVRGLQDRDLIENRHRCEWGLLQTRSDALTVAYHLLGMLVQARAEARRRPPAPRTASSRA